MSERSGSNEVAGTNKRSFPRRFFWLFRSLVLLVLLALLVLLGFGGSNLWLASRWGKGMVESKLEDRTGLEWQVGSMSWSPWNGCTMRDVRMLQPDELRVEFDQPVISIKRIRVQPYWSRLLRGGMRPREVIVDAPQLRLSVEMLAALLEDMGKDLIEEPPAVVPPALAANSAHAGPAGVPRPGQSSGPPRPPGLGPGAPSLPPQPPAPAQAAPPKVERLPAGLPMHLRVKDASVHLVSLGKGVDLLRMDQISLDMPIYGEDAAGKLEVGSVQIAGLPEFSGLEQVLAWKRPVLEFEKKVVDLGGLKIRFHPQWVMGNRLSGKIPFLLDVSIEPQQVESIESLESMGMEVSAGKLAGKFRLLGILASPMTWQAEVLVLGETLSMKRAQGGPHAEFDVLYLPAVLRQGQLQWGGVKMIGEDLSILGNGRLSPYGVLAVTRLVASPELAKELAKGLDGVGITADGWWYNLDTPDRKVRDLTVSGSLSGPIVDAGGREHAAVPLYDVIASVFDFARLEMKQDQGLVPMPKKVPNEVIKKEPNKAPNKTLNKGEQLENH